MLTLEDLEKMPQSRLLTPAEVAEVFRVDPKTVTRWASPHRDTGRVKLNSIRTTGGHRRFTVRDVLASMGRDA